MWVTKALSKQFRKVGAVSIRKNGKKLSYEHMLAERDNIVLSANFVLTEPDDVFLYRENILMVIKGNIGLMVDIKDPHSFLVKIDQDMFEVKRGLFDEFMDGVLREIDDFLDLHHIELLYSK